MLAGATLDGDQAASAVVGSNDEDEDEICCVELGTESGVLTAASVPGMLSLAVVLCDHVSGSTEDRSLQPCSEE